MKAVINGTTIEGTPQEIAEYQRITEERQRNPFNPAIGPNSTLAKQIADANNNYGAMAVVSLTDLFKVAHKNTGK